MGKMATGAGGSQGRPVFAADGGKLKFIALNEILVIFINRRIGDVVFNIFRL